MLVSPADFVAKAKATITECSVKEVHENRDADTLLIDIREPAEFARGHIQGAFHIPRGMLEFEILKLLEHHTESPANCDIILYCGTGGRSALATKSLNDMGFANVQSMDGGIVAWAEARYPLEVPKG